MASSLSLVPTKFSMIMITNTLDIYWFQALCIKSLVPYTSATIKYLSINRPTGQTLSLPYKTFVHLKPMQQILNTNLSNQRKTKSNNGRYTSKHPKLMPLLIVHEWSKSLSLHDKILPLPSTIGCTTFTYLERKPSFKRLINLLYIKSDKS